MRVRRAVLMSVAAMALLLAAPSTARADLDFGDLMDFLDELMKSAGLGAWVDELAAIVAIFEQTFEPGLYLENPTIYSPDDAAERAGEVYENRLDQVVSANVPSPSSLPPSPPPSFLPSPPPPPSPPPLPLPPSPLPLPPSPPSLLAWPPRFGCRCR